MRKVGWGMNLQHDAGFRPLLVLAYVDSAHAAHCGRYFRRLGWEVRLVASAGEARRLVADCNPRAVVLDTELPDESGWLTCAKIMQECPECRVFLLAPERGYDTNQNLASVNAAGVVCRQDAVDSFAETVLGECLAEAV